jgi:outer membrane protein OmpA-like peptidoglycan-associated protein
MKSTALIAFASLALLSACASQQQHQPPAESTPQTMAASAEAVSPLLQLKNQLAALEPMGLKLDESADAWRVTMPGALVFASGSSMVEPAAHQALDQIALAMTAVPQAKATVTGHTDSTGATRYNQSLSEARAKAVLAYIAGKGVEAARMTADGRGEAEPVADNATAKGRATNRRVELLLSVQ